MAASAVVRDEPYWSLYEIALSSLLIRLHLSELARPLPPFRLPIVSKVVPLV